MSRLALLSRVVFARPVERLHLRRAAAIESGAAEHPRAGDDRDRHRDDHARTEAERLERISVYARAGYFHMSYTLEMYTLGELPHE